MTYNVNKTEIDKFRDRLVMKIITPIYFFIQPIQQSRYLIFDFKVNVLSLKNVIISSMLF